MTDTPLPGYSGMPPAPSDGAPQSSATPQPTPPPSFGLPPETPIMPGTSDHHIEPVVIPPSSIDVEPLSPVKRAVPPPISSVILPQHKAPEQNTTPPPPVPNTTQVPATPELEVPPAPLTPPQRTSMYDAPVRGSINASPKDYGIIENKPIAPKIPPLPSEHRPSAQDMLYESALGKPLEGPVIPSTRRPQQTPQSPTTARLNPSVLETPPTPSEMVRDAAQAGVAPQTPAEAANELARHTAIRTLESDVAKTVSQNRLSVSSMALAQQKERLSQTLDEGVHEKHFSWWALAGIILAVLGVGVVTVAYVMQVHAPEPAEQEVITTQEALIPNVSETTLDITNMKRSDITRALEALTTQYASRNGISLVRFITYRDEVVEEESVRLAGDVTAEQFLTQLSSRAGSRLTRALGEQSFFGVVSVGGRAVPFLAFEATSYDSAFAGMLEWESFLPEDVPFLTHILQAPAPAPQPVVATSTATSTKTSTSTQSLGTTTRPSVPKPVATTVVPTAPSFVDIVVQNRDARAIKNSDGSTRLLYAFPTPVVLLIAQDETALSAIVEHLTTARFSK